MKNMLFVNVCALDVVKEKEYKVLTVHHEDFEMNMFEVSVEEDKLVQVNDNEYLVKGSDLKFLDEEVEINSEVNYSDSLSDLMDLFEVRY